jgi:hypothetical protein
VAFAVPLDLVLIAAAVSELETIRRGLGAVLGACVAATAIGGLIDSHRARGFYLDARGVASYMRAQDLGGGAVIAPGDAGAQLPLLYYGLHADWYGSWQAAAVLRRLANPLWVLYELPTTTNVDGLVKSIRPLAHMLGYRPLSARVFPGVTPLAVVRMSLITTRPKVLTSARSRRTVIPASPAASRPRCRSSERRGGGCLQAPRRTFPS